MHARILLCALLLVMAPAASADGGDGNGRDGGNGDGSGHGGNEDDNAGKGRGNGGHGGPAPPSENATEESIDLTGKTRNATAILTWVFHGHAGRVASFEVARSINGGAPQVIATLDRFERSFTDSQATSATSAYTYSVTAHHVDDAQPTTSNSAIVVGCNWISIYPGGVPPVLFHPECL